MRIGKLLKYNREREYLSVKDLANVFGMSPGHLNDIENGRVLVPISGKYYKKIARYLKMTVIQYLKIAFEERLKKRISEEKKIESTKNSRFGNGKNL
jgi:transcriptional regulator with XRE-family HTH domain